MQNSRSAKAEWKMVSQTEPMVMPEDRARLLVGWKVVSNWGDGTNGKWRNWKKTATILSHSGETRATSDAYRGMDWTTYWYYVDTDLYQFGD